MISRNSANVAEAIEYESASDEDNKDPNNAPEDGTQQATRYKLQKRVNEEEWDM